MKARRIRQSNITGMDMVWAGSRDGEEVARGAHDLLAASLHAEPPKDRPIAPQTQRARAEPIRVQLLNLAPESGVAAQVNHLLQTSHEPPVQVRLLSADFSQLSTVSTKLTTMLAGSMPDVTICVLASATRKLWPAFFREYDARRLTAPLVAVLTGDDPSAAETALRCGATDYLVPPIRPIDLLPRLRCVWAPLPKGEVSARQFKEAEGLNGLVGDSPAFLAQVRKIPRFARAEHSVLILGETGTGKDICARALHYVSQRRARPFVPFNCGTVPVELVENELFGHESGAFTGANGSAVGLVPAAEGGTLFLDEVDALPLPVQAKLLRFLQDKEFLRLGSAKVRKADVRIIAASNIQLAEAVKARSFRADLYYRLNVLRLELPPLRERGEDVVLLAHQLLAKSSGRQGRPPKRLSPAALCRLLFYDWPGNVRELENVMARAVTLSDRSIIDRQDIHLPRLRATAAEGTFRAQKEALIKRFEAQYLTRLLLAYQGNVSQAAHEAGKERHEFRRLLRRHHIQIPRAIGC